jgi:hypothetical protein
MFLWLKKTPASSAELLVQKKRYGCSIMEAYAGWTRVVRRRVWWGDVYLDDLPSNRIDCTDPQSREFSPSLAHILGFMEAANTKRVLLDFVQTIKVGCQGMPRLALPKKVQDFYREDILV